MESTPVQTFDPVVTPQAAAAVAVANGFISVSAWADEQRTVLIPIGTLNGVPQALSVTYDPNAITEEARRTVMLHINDEDSPVAPTEIASWIHAWGLQGPLKVKRWVDVLDANGEPTGKQTRIVTVLQNDPATNALPVSGEVLAAVRSSWMSKIMTAIFEDSAGEARS